MWSLGGDDDGAAGFGADARIAVGQLGIKVQGIPGIEDFIIHANSEVELTGQHKDQFDPGVLVNVDFLGGQSVKFDEAGVELPVRGEKIERLKIESGRLDFGGFGKARSFLRVKAKGCSSRSSLKKCSRSKAS